MALDEDFLSAVERPERAALREALDSATTGTARILRKMGVHAPADWLVRQMAYSYVNDWRGEDRRYVLLLPGPGRLGTRYLGAVRRFERSGPDQSAAAKVAFDRRLATERLTEVTPQFTARFLSAVDATASVDVTVDDPVDYVRSGRFFEEFHVTGVFKYRTEEYTEAGVEAAVEEQLSAELRAVDPDVVFACGDLAWRTVREQFGARPVADDGPGGDGGDGTGYHDRIAGVQGHAFETTSVVETYVVPTRGTGAEAWRTGGSAATVAGLDAGLDRMGAVE